MELAEMRNAVAASVEAERQQYAPEPDNESDSQFTSEEILEQLNRNADGDTFLYIELNRNRLVFDCAAGRLS